MPGALSRRRFLGGTAAAVATTAAGATIVGGCTDSKTTAAAHERQWFGFNGLHQHGVATPPQENAIVAAFDTVASNRAELEAMFRALTGEVSDLMNGVVTEPVDELLPPSDNLIVGVEPSADDLTITIGVGSSLFDDRFDLVDLMPRQLMPMPTFPNDKPDPNRLHGDLVVQIGAGTAETCNHALRRVMRVTRDSLVVRWLLPGFVKPNMLAKGRTSVRNLLGFKDGTANLDASDEALLDDLVWVQPSDREPEWAIGGTYQAIRLIRNRVEFWDRTPLRTQETIIGRHKATGAPLDGSDEADIPDFAADGDGSTFRLDGHIRLANPRTPDTEKNRILRRGFNYSAGFDRAGQLDQGLLFVCFQRSLVDGFITVQNRLNGEALEEYITPFGGGLFYVLPGVPTDGGFFASGLFA